MSQPLTLFQCHLSKKNDERVRTLMKWGLMCLQWYQQLRRLSLARHSSRFRISTTKLFLSLQRPPPSRIPETKPKCRPMAKPTTWAFSNSLNTAVQITKRFNQPSLRKKEDWLQKAQSLAVWSCATSNKTSMLRLKTREEPGKRSSMVALRTSLRWSRMQIHLQLLMIQLKYNEIVGTI